jgi:tight adherence protein B
VLTVVAAACAGAGTYLLCTRRSVGLRAAPVAARRSPASTVRTWLAQADLGDVRVGQLALVCATAALVGGAGAWALFGGLLPAVLAGACVAGAPLVSLRARRRARLAAAQDAWPRLIEEVRLQTGALGRSVPQALFDVGQRAPVELRPAFEAARREWLLSTDFARTVALLRRRLADPAADAALEVLLVAHELGGTGLDRRLADLAEDRRLDAALRKDAVARQAGVRFARRFTLLVPLGMAAVGLTIGPGRAAYATAGGQLVAALGIVIVLACWLWAGTLLRLPDPRQVADR